MATLFSSMFRSSAKRPGYRDLLNLDDHLLRDIGLTRSDVRQLMAGRRTPGHRAHE